MFLTAARFCRGFDVYFAPLLLQPLPRDDGRRSLPRQEIPSSRIHRRDESPFAKHLHCAPDYIGAELRSIYIADSAKMPADSSIGQTWSVGTLLESLKSTGCALVLPDCILARGVGASLR
jgi:hypothetical protein